MRAGLTFEEFKTCSGDSINEPKARAFAVMTNLAFGIEVALKGKLTNKRLRAIHKDNRHNLRILFNKLPRIEQEQLRIDVKNILVINDEVFEKYLKICENGFVEWRYFFEKKKEGRSYNYLMITMFLYAMAYYLITGEGFESILEPCEFKKRCYVGQWGFFREREQV